MPTPSQPADSHASGPGPSEGGAPELPGTSPPAFDAEARRLHARLSSAGERFLDHVERHPEVAERSRYGVLESDKRGVIRRLQTWPLFLDRRAQDRCAEAVIGIWRLVREAPMRVFGGDPERVGAFYDLDPPTARVIARLLNDPAHLAPIVARGDFVETEAGYSLIEVNVAGNLGGWTTGLWERLYLQAPPVRDFVRREGLALVGVDPMDTFFAHTLALASSAGLDDDGEVNVALAVAPERMGDGALPALGAERYRSFLEGWGDVRGDLWVCSYEDLEVIDDRRVELHGRRVHLMVESYDGIVPHGLFVPWMAGGVVILNGPVGRFLNDRRTLALLSEHAESDLFTEAEREVIRRHLPWTRVVRAEDATFRGRRRPVPELAVDEREALVLKRSASLGGEQVFVGASTEPEEWRRLVERAVEEGNWIAQERLISLPYVFQQGEAGWGPHDVVWGLFAFGDRYGGGFIRVMPKGGEGVVNSSRGADDGAFLVVEEL